MKKRENGLGMNQITLLIVDDHPLFRQGVVDALSLEPDMRIIAQSAAGDEALELIRTKKPTIAVRDGKKVARN